MFMELCLWNSVAVDICRTIDPFLIADGYVADLEVQFVGTKQQIKIPEGVKVAKVAAVLDDSLIMLF